MGDLRCCYCGSTQYDVRAHSMHGSGAWCQNCGRHIRWLGKVRTPEQQEQRAKTKKLYTLEWMSTKEPTEAQMALLRRMGYRGFVSSRLHAHNLINERVQGR